MKKSYKFKKGSTSGPGPLLVLVILVIIIVVIFFLAGYLETQLPDNLRDDSSETTDSVLEEEDGLNSLEFRTLSQGVYSKYSESGGLIIENVSNFKTLWAQTAGGVPPDVDFDTQVVLAVFAGDQPTSGYSIKISEITRKDGHVTADVTLAIPGNDCVVNSVITNPYHIVSLNREDSEIEFVSYDEVLDCE